MNKLIITALLMVAGMASMQAQKTYTFEYDNNGNRTSRSTLKSGSSADFESIEELLEELAEESEPETDVFGEQTVKIYPNPTKGKMKVEITDMEAETIGMLEVFDMKGQKLVSTVIVEANIPVDLTNQPAGMYILKITLNNQTKEWTVIKE